LQHLRGGAIRAQRLFQRLHDFLPVAPLVMSIKINDDYAAKIAQAYLPHDFFDRVDIGFDDCVFQPRRLATYFVFTSMATSASV